MEVRARPILAPVPFGRVCVAAFALAVLGALASGCGRGGETKTDAGQRPGEALHQALREKNPAYNGQGQFDLREGRLVGALRECGVSDLAPLRQLPLRELDLQKNPVRDLEPLRGLPLEALYLEETLVDDLRPLDGMGLRVLYLSGTKVTGLGPLRGMPLRELNLLGTRVADLAPLQAAPLETLWLNETPVSDISPLRGVPLVSLTLHRTAVSDLSPLRGLRSLERLHVADTPVADLGPLAGLSLTRLIFSPGRIRSGIEAARKMVSIREIGTSLDGRMDPAEFWPRYDRGEFRR
jgi:hypothetical protein